MVAPFGKLNTEYGAYIFNLPDNYKPAFPVLHATCAYIVTGPKQGETRVFFVTIDDKGGVRIHSGDTINWLALDGVSFRAR
jgi:hypothetical protein